MSIHSVLAASGGFASRKPIPHKVKIPTIDGFIEETLYFLDLPATDVRDLLNLEGKDRDAEFICKTLCNEDGSPALSLEGEHGAKALKLKVAAALVAAALEALGLTKEAKSDAKKD